MYPAAFGDLTEGRIHQMARSGVPPNPRSLAHNRFQFIEVGTPTPDNPPSLKNVDPQLFCHGNWGTANGLEAGPQMGPIVQKHPLLAVIWIEECHYIGTILHGTGSPSVHATLKEALGLFTKLSSQGTSADAPNTANRICA